jgi:hypothetical protein
MMSACTLTSVSLPPYLSALAMVYRPETTNQLSKPQHLDFPFIGYRAGSALTTAPQNFGRQEDMLPDYRPRTELGEKLLALRRAYIEKGGRLLSAGELEEELRSRRGGVGDA